VSESPAFQFYPADFLADANVEFMSNQERGCYIMLMCYCWREGSIPNDVEKIARLCREDGSAMAKLWQNIKPCFTVAMTEPGKLVHARLEKEREKQEKHRIERSMSGKKGAESLWNKRKKKHGSAMAKPMAKPMAKDGSSSSSSSSSSPTGLKTTTYTPDFEIFWNAHPGGGSKAKAFESWQKISPTAELQAIILKAIETQKTWRQWQEGFIQHGVTWLNQRGWEAKRPAEPTVRLSPQDYAAKKQKEEREVAESKRFMELKKRELGVV
jgi:uncharacterized protein YdaU (DUF1376 family)